MNLVVVLLQRDFHHVDNLSAFQRLNILTPEHLLSTEFPLVDRLNLSDRDDYCRLLREAFECQIVLVDEETALVEHEIPLDQVVVLIDELADRSVHNDTVISLYCFLY